MIRVTTTKWSLVQQLADFLSGAPHSPDDECAALMRRLLREYERRRIEASARVDGKPPGRLAQQRRRLAAIRSMASGS